MKLHVESRRRITVVAGFIIFMAVSTLTAYLLGGRPSPAEACQRQCASSGKAGVLNYSGPATSKSFYKEAHSECQCR